MKALAEFAIRRRWWVIAGWITFIVAAQGIAGAMGGAAYKDTFSLPHTETATVATLLKDAGLSNQNGVTGTVVVRNTDGAAFTGAPSAAAADTRQAVRLGRPRRARLDAVDVDRLLPERRGRARQPQTAELGARVGHRPRDDHVGEQPLRPRVVQERLRHGQVVAQFDAASRVHRQRVRRDRAVHRFEHIGVHRLPGRADHPCSGLPHGRRDRTAAGLRVRRARRWPGRHLHSQSRHQRLEHHAVPGRTDGDRCRCRLRAVHRDPTPPQPAPRHASPGIGRHRTQHVRPRGAVRGDHCLHCHPRPHRTGRELLQRDGGGYRARGWLHDGRVTDAAAGAAQPVRTEGLAAQTTGGRARRRISSAACPWVSGLAGHNWSPAAASPSPSVPVP